MGAAYNATQIKVGTATTFKASFYRSIMRNKEEAKQKSTHIRNHFEYDCDVACKYNKNYAKYVANERKRLGEKSDEFLMSYKLQWIVERGMLIDVEKFEKRQMVKDTDKGHEIKQLINDLKDLLELYKKGVLVEKQSTSDDSDFS